VILLPASRQLRIPRQLEDTKEAGRWLAILVGVIVIESFALWGYQALAGAVPKSIAPGLKLPIMAVLGAVMLFILFVPLGLVALAARIWINRTLGQADYDRALSRAQTAAKLIPFQFGNVLFGPEQGRILLTAAHYDEAEAALYAALEKGQEAGTAGNVQYECLDLLGQVMLEQERFDEAIQCLEGAIDIRPDQSAAYDSLAGVYLWMGDQPGQALELTKQALTLYKPRRLFGRVAAPAMWMNRAWALAQLRRDKANEAYDRAFALMKSESKPALADLHCRAGAVCYGQGDMDTATHHFEQAIQLDPTGRAGQLARRALQAEQ
jgi:tetratricopeptide (TPR) repeat protein